MSSTTQAIDGSVTVHDFIKNHYGQQKAWSEDHKLIASSVKGNTGYFVVELIPSGVRSIYEAKASKDDDSINHYCRLAPVDIATSQIPKRLLDLVNDDKESVKSWVSDCLILVESLKQRKNNTDRINLYLSNGYGATATITTKAYGKIKNLSKSSRSKSEFLGYQQESKLSFKFRHLSSVEIADMLHKIQKDQ